MGPSGSLCAREFRNLDLNVSGFGEEGLVGITVGNDNKENKVPYVYLYFTDYNRSDTFEKKGIVK
jgi:hypothetical protein